MTGLNFRGYIYILYKTFVMNYYQTMYTSWKRKSKIMSLCMVWRCGSMLPHLHTIYNDIILLNLFTEI